MRRLWKSTCQRTEVEATAPNTLPKKERLCGKTSIGKLLAKGKHGNVPGLRFLYMTGTGNEENRMMVSVPKKMFKRAVKRNLLKRRIRESWRRQKHSLSTAGGTDILFIYPGKEILSYEEIYESVGKIIRKINSAQDKIEKTDETVAE